MSTPPSRWSAPELGQHRRPAIFPGGRLSREPEPDGSRGRPRSEKKARRGVSKRRLPEVTVRIRLRYCRRRSPSRMVVAPIISALKTREHCHEFHPIFPRSCGNAACIRHPSAGIGRGAQQPSGRFGDAIVFTPSAYTPPRRHEPHVLTVAKPGPEQVRRGDRVHSERIYTLRVSRGPARPRHRAGSVATGMLPLPKAVHRRRRERARLTRPTGQPGARALLKPRCGSRLRERPAGRGRVREDGGSPGRRIRGESGAFRTSATHRRTQDSSTALRRPSRGVRWRRQHRQYRQGPGLRRTGRRKLVLDKASSSSRIASARSFLPQRP